jgi:ABC-type polysaccharide/polyol phosphate transport system ATPase subunit
MDSVWLDGVSLQRRVIADYHYDLKKTVFSILERRRSTKFVQILTDINLAVRQGEQLGIIGANGSGKSTLLKVIAGVLRPTTGTVQVRGDVAALIELGAGFDGEVSALDNIVSYGVMLGMSRAEIRARAAGVLEWAELTEYGTTPLKNFSTGMAARLGFALATEARPNVLIVDEVLSVGDEHFQHKCDERMRQMWSEGTTVLLVSHDLGYVRRACSRVAWIDQGVIRAVGRPANVVDAYLNDVREREEASAEDGASRALVV